MNVWIWGTGQIAENVCMSGLCAEIKGFIETKKNKRFFSGSSGDRCEGDTV